MSLPDERISNAADEAGYRFTGLHHAQLAIPPGGGRTLTSPPPGRPPCGAG